MVIRGQVWTMIRGARQYRALIITNDEFNDLEGVPVWALAISRDARPGHLTVPLVDGDPLSGCGIRVPAVMQIADRSELREVHGLVSHATMNAVEAALRELLTLP